MVNMKIRPVYLGFLNSKPIIKQYKHHIRNQHQKLSRKTYVSLKNNFHQKSALYTPTASYFEKFFLWSPSGSIFDESYFLMKHMFFDSVFDADSEYDVYIA